MPAVSRRQRRSSRAGTRRRRRSPAATIVLVVVLAVAGALAGWRWWNDRQAEALPPDVGVVVRHVDGDTADVRINGTVERVRFIGIDTPESYRSDGPPDCFGAEASARTAALLPLDTEVRLTGDIVGRDDYGRLLAYVYRRHDELFVNLTLVVEGYAKTLRIAPNTTHAAEFAAAASAAQRDGRGLWSACSA